MIDVREAATRKIGPLPAWAWGAVIGGGFLIYRFATGGGGGASSSNVDTIAGGTPFDYDAAAGGGGGAGGGGVLSSDGSVAPGIVDAPTNAGRSVPTPRRTVPTPTVIVQTPVTPLVQSNQATRRTGDTSRRPANPFPLPLGLPVWRADAVADDVSASMDAYMLTPPGVPSYPIPAKATRRRRLPRRGPRAGPAGRPGSTTAPVTTARSGHGATGTIRTPSRSASPRGRAPARTSSW